MSKQIQKQVVKAAMSRARTDVPIRHFSYHKNLTVYYLNVARAFSELTGRAFKHFQSNRDEFLAEQAAYDMASLNNHYVETGALPDGARVSRFVRDPRDLVVSGYHYHKRGAEAWCRIPDPREADWTVVNGLVPEGMAPGESFADYLQRVDLETGLIAEIEFRRRHLESMRSWIGRADVMVIRYEEIMQDEVAAFARLAEHYRLSRMEAILWAQLAKRYSKAGSRARRSSHVRDPRAGQWRDAFSDRVTAHFEERYGDVVEALGY